MSRTKSIGSSPALRPRKDRATSSGRVSFVGCVPGNMDLDIFSLFFFFAATGKSNGGTHGGLSDTFSNYHNYTVSQRISVALVKC